MNIKDVRRKEGKRLGKRKKRSIFARKPKMRPAHEIMPLFTRKEPIAKRSYVTGGHIK